ncbi:MAG: hypothetical protein ACO3YY_05400 [Phycisphaerales bacterium]|jgi:hypothetical protein
MSDGDQRNGRGGSTRGVDGWQSRLGTLGVVTAVTVLIWTWAAGKTESSEILDGVELRFTTTEPSRLRITPPTIRLSQLTARGSTRALNRLRELPRTFEFTAGSGGVPATEGTHVLSVSDLFSRISEVADSGLAIDAEPATVEIVVTALESRTLRLEAELPGVSTQGDTEVQPPTAELLLPAAMEVPASQLFAIAAVNAAQLDRLEPGRRETVNASLRLPPELAALAGSAIPLPATARVTFTPRVLDRETVLPRVPVQIAGISEDFTRYRIESSPAFLDDVEIRGPAETIGRIEAGTRVLAFVHLTTDELESAAAAAAPITKAISMWLLPAGVEVRRVGEIEGARPEISLRVERIAEPSNG